jgi:hypothetical protein
MKEQSARNRSAKPAPVVCEGQVWKVGDIHVAVVAVGKTLIHFKRFKHHPRGTQIQLSSRPDFDAYLRANGAALLPEATPAKRVAA